MKPVKGDPKIDATARALLKKVETMFIKNNHTVCNMDESGINFMQYVGDVLSAKARQFIKIREQQRNGGIKGNR